MGEIEFVEDPLVFEIRREAVIVKWSTGLKQAIPLNVFRENCRRANAALAVYDGCNGQVVPIRPRRKR